MVFVISCLWTVRSLFPGADGSFYCLPLFCACKALKIKDFSAPNCPHKTSFSVHFLFSAACELWRHSRGSILPGWIWGRTHRRRPRSVSSPYPGKSPLPASRPAARPPSGTTYSRPRKKPSAGRCRCPHRQGQCSCRPHSNSTPGGSGRLPVSSVPVSCGKGNCPACALWAAVVYMGSLSCVSSILLSVAALPEKASCPISAACSGVGTLPAASGHLSRSDLWTKCPEVRLLAMLPLPGYSFSDGHSVFKVLSIDELSQVYTFLTVCAVYPKGRKSAKKTAYFHALGIVVK